MNTRELINQTKHLMRIRSTADRPDDLRKAVEFVAAILDAHSGITVERFEHNGKLSLLAYRDGPRPEKFDILLNAHVDVVPGKPELFVPTEKDGRLYGRGALDMKGTAVVMTDVFCELVNEVPYALALQIVCDEEVGGYDCVCVQLHDGVRANFVIMGEYANDRHTIYNAARGLCWAEIGFKGKTAHGGHLWHGSNAVVKAGAFAGAVLKRYPTPDKETWTTTASISDLSTPNDAFNKVPDRAVLKIDFRFTQEDPVFRSRESLIEFIHELDPEAELLNTATFEPAVHVEELNPYVQGLSRAQRSVTKKQTKFLGRPAGSDGRHYALVNNDIVEFGLYGKHPHGDHEYAELASFAEYRHILRAFLCEPLPKKPVKAKREPLQEELLRSLVAMPTLSNNPAANGRAMDFIEEFLRSRGMHVERLALNGHHNLIATTKPGNKRPAVLLNAHTDVVPGPDELFKLTLKDGKFYGRGVMDMKHAIAAYLTVVDALREDLDAYDFGIMITSDEEIGSNNGVKPLVAMGYHPKVVIVPDGGNDWKLETFAKGVKWVKLEATGKSAHASRPWEGDSAIHRLLDAIKDIKALMPRHPSPEDTLMSIGTISGGHAANQIAAAASAMLDIRPGSIADHERLTPQIKVIGERHGVTVTFQADEPPCVTDPGHELIKPMIDIVREVTGTTHGTTYDFAVTDGRIFSAAGIPVIVINPECGNIHREDEWLSQKGLAQFCQVLELYVRRMAVYEPDLARDREQGIAELAKRLNKQDEPAYVWYACYGSGLYRQNFMSHVKGEPQAGALKRIKGCRDTSEPMKDVFSSIPYQLYFSGISPFWGGGQGRIEPLPNPEAHTIARLYLITLEQFKDLYQSMNESEPLPAGALQTALKYGHATIGDGTRDYDGLIFCGMREGHPIFTLTAAQVRTPYVAPSEAYTRVLCQGLSEATGSAARKGAQRLMAAPGVLEDEHAKRILASFQKNGQSR